MAAQPRFNTGYGLSDALPNIFPSPIVSQRAPTANDTGYQIGQTWINQSGGGSVYTIVLVAAGQATWLQDEVAGGAGSFTTLTSTDVFTLDTAIAAANTLVNLVG